jgi:hypothetical protein
MTRCADGGHTESSVRSLMTALNASGPFIDRKDAQQWLDRLTATPK